MILTKSHYITAQHCRKRLWLTLHRPEMAMTTDPGRRLRLAQGNQVGAAARSHFPDGTLIGGYGETALDMTRAAIDRGDSTLFEATFRHRDLLVRCDILTRTPNDRWEIIEVKSTTDVKREHLDDLAIQYYVVERNGLAVESVKLMTLNRACRYPNLDSLFSITNVTAKTNPLIADIPATLAALADTLNDSEPPSVSIGSRCDQPYPCPFKEECWADVPECSIFTIPRLNRSLGDELAARGYLSLADLPSTVQLSHAQRAHVSRMLRGSTDIDYAAIRERLASLVYPVHFFDFETASEPIPRHQDSCPYQQIPFQYSCHRLYADGTVDHRDYLHVGSDDPRRALVDALLKDIGPIGSVVVYNAGFERRILRELARDCEARSVELNQIEARLWDQLDIFRLHYRSAAFGGSNSIKRVLPALVPSLSYADLAIRQGDVAQVRWIEMINCEAPIPRAKLIADLRAYCARDTEAMLAIHWTLAALIELESMRAGAISHPALPRLS